VLSGTQSCTASANSTHYVAGQFVSGQTCASCATGRFSVANNTVSCTFCSQGQFQASTGKSACSLCPVNTFANFTGMTHCFHCPNGETSVQGSSSINACTSSSCTLTSAPANGNVGSCSNVPFGQPCNIQCNSGYSVNGSAYFCNAGSLTGGAQACHPSTPLHCCCSSLCSVLSSRPLHFEPGSKPRQCWHVLEHRVWPFVQHRLQWRLLDQWKPIHLQCGRAQRDTVMHSICQLNALRCWTICQRPNLRKLCKGTILRGK